MFPIKNMFIKILDFKTFDCPNVSYFNHLNSFVQVLNCFCEISTEAQDTLF